MGIVKQDKFFKETNRLRQTDFKNILILFKDHAEAMMLERGLNENDVMSILENGFVVDNESSSAQEHKWLVEGKSIDGRRSQVVVGIAPDYLRVEIITVINKTRR